MQAQAIVEGGTAPERRLLRQILSASAATAIERARLRTTASGASIHFVDRRTDRWSSTRAKWLTMLVGNAFAEASSSLRLPPVRRFDILTPGLSKANGRLLVIGHPSTRARPSRPLTAAAISQIALRAQQAGIDVRRVLVVRILGLAPEAVEVTGRLRNPAAYQRVLSDLVRPSSAGRGVFYELTDARGRTLVRLGSVIRLRPDDQVVAWVHPSLLKRA